jgi:hypothetical protein
MTEEEKRDAFEEWDLSSLEMRGRIICRHCAEVIYKSEHQTV